jgi:hypothetical protein
MGRAAAWLLLLGLLLAACRPAPTAPGAQQYSGAGPAELGISWDGPAILRIQAGRGGHPFRLTAGTGLDGVRLVESDGRVDEYRGYVFTATDPAHLSVEGDRDWKITLLPPSTEAFPVLRIPGEYKGRGNAVVRVEGKYGIATFDVDRTRRIQAWAFGPEGTAQELYIKPDGDYKGKTVLPEGMGWLVVSAAGPWSVEILGPCCEAPW